jgi:hypothetical protein
VVIYKYPHIVGIGDDAVGHVRSSAFPVDMYTGAAEGGVCEVTVVHGRFTASWNVEAVETLASELWGRCIKLEGGMAVRKRRGRRRRRGREEEEKEDRDRRETRRKRRGGRGGERWREDKEEERSR